MSVFRGLPSNKHNPNGYRRNQAQMSEWTRDRRVEDVIILASHDTDLEPALAAAIENDNVTIETAGWRNCKRLKPTGNKQLRHTVLDKSHFERSRDHKDYA